MNKEYRGIKTDCGVYHMADIITGGTILVKYIYIYIFIYDIMMTSFASLFMDSQAMFADT